MSQPGYGYAVPDGYIHQGFAQSAPSAQKKSIDPSSIASQIQSDERIKYTPGYGHNMIPGLGLGVPNPSLTAHRSEPTEHTTSWRSAQQSSPYTKRTVTNLEKTQNAVRIPGLAGTQDAASEDGEISEDGELGDTYEPKESHLHVAAPGQIQTSEFASGRDPAQTVNQGSNISERSGSYSPYLSLEELSQDNNSPDAQTGTLSNLSAVATDLTIEGHTARQPMATIPGNRGHLGQSHLQVARKEAKDAILRLWPLNIRFQNYLSEGIDEAILKSLFKDLGLSIAEPTQVSEVQVAKQSGITNSEENSISKDTAVEEPRKPGSTAMGKSEERKDRIARLLAAKGSKQNPPTISAPVVPVVSVASTASLTNESAAKSAKPSLTPLEKSKLIQEKIAALKKSREVPQQEKLGQLENGVSSRNNSASTSTGGVNGDATKSEPPADTIPGLSLTSSIQAAQLLDAIEQPAATLTTAGSKFTHSATPFDRYPKSRPFLINVSDGEDDEDEEMEIDSPGQPETPPNLRGTSVHHDPMLQDVPGLSDSAAARHIRSPASIPTPLRSISRNNGGNLESMNKQIEEMKRKIAEAEARKKAKSSRQGSPALSHRNDSSFEDNSDVATRPTAPTKRFYGDLGSKPSLSPNLDRRSRSRAASERLPLLEARRRGQLEKLRSLQSEVARIEMELEEDKLEEELLKGEIISSDSDKDGQVIPVAPAAKSTEVCICEGEEMPTAEAIESGDQGEASRGCTPATMQVADLSGNNGEDHAAIESVSQILKVDGGASNIGSASSKLHSSQSDTPPSIPDLDSHGDVAMEDTGYSADEDAEGDTDGYYEPPDATESANNDDSDFQMQDATSPVQNDASPRAGQVISGVPTTEMIDSEQHETVGNSKSAVSDTVANSFVSYKTPLQHFHAYRFHPSFRESVAGGLRSLTYSNKIDVNKQLCPDELAGQLCPRGNHCEFQHFGTMQAPDDQILLQLGAAEHYDEKQKEEYNSGLRQLLTDYRNQKVKDFNTISQGIVDYRVKFNGDKTKILPLGHVTI
ncbi:hypothetical protein QQS21_009020 [Conoideocrella luteorostrata]|uniref:C3H1-type domain-containing protein n=1 Tax=Conoideocrella luteorostrata TaxID=1105319 RepID=A0AAJ0CHT8_9HYPO|nr:hypothetical protein QQS21_009020 [Conoideocrella luteorostrata]